jgi:hypothetical protein
MEALAVLERDVATLAAVDLGALGLEDVQALAVGVERLAGQLRGIASRALSTVAEAEPETVAWWWRDALGITGEAAGVAVRRARGLRSLPMVEDAVVAGSLSLEQAGALVPLVGKLDELQLYDMQPELISGAARRSVDGIGQWVRHLIALNSEQDLVLEQASAQDRRIHKHRLCEDGTLRGHYVLPAEDAEVFLTVLESLSRRQGLSDPRHAGQRRADALVEMADQVLRWGELPHTGGQRAHLFYVMSSEWAAGQAGASPAGSAWTGPQTRGAIEALCCDARISRVLLDGTGQVQGLETLNDDITAAQRRAVSARDRHCVAHGCSRPPAFCDVHHLVARADGGPTTVQNLVLMCRRHHVMWHKGLLALAELRLPWLSRFPGSAGPDEPRAGPLVA